MTGCCSLDGFDIVSFDGLTFIIGETLLDGWGQKRAAKNSCQSNILKTITIDMLSKDQIDSGFVLRIFLA